MPPVTADPVRLPGGRRRGRVVGFVLAASIAAVPAVPQIARAEQETLSESEAPEATTAAYTVRISGVEDDAIRSVLERSSQLISLRDKPPAGQPGLVRRIEGDFERFRTVLRSEGYYDSTVDYRIDETTSPQTIIVVVDTGPAYKLQAYDVAYVGDDAVGAPEPPPLTALGLQLGKRARSADILAAERKILGTLANEARPLARLADRDAVVDHRDRSMRVDVHIDPGPFARFGSVTFEGLDTVRESYVRTLVPWRQDEPYDQRKVDALRNKLIKSGLFSTVIVDRPERLEPDGTLPLTISFIEGKQRSIGAGAKYYTSEGPAGEVFWEHRNLFGSNEDLRITLEVGQILQEATVDFTKPDYRRPDQDFLAQVQATRQTTDAFDELGVSTTGRVRRPLSETWTGSLGGSLEWSQLKDRSQGTSSSTLVGVPSYLARDATDSLLDPTTGTRLRLDATPYAGWFEQTAHFLVTSLGGSAYVPLDGDRRFVAAARAKVGSIVGQSRAEIPPNKRFYAGGGDSIRGYQFQKVGPLDSRNDPIGGRSLAEVSAELRTRVWGNFGVVPFVDGGNVYTPMAPDFSEGFRWAAGFGLRYITVIGPVRFDMAFPLNRRRDVDDAFQFYISLGQAF